jgi:ActR/RegA family two-component response regulator
MTLLNHDHRRILLIDQNRTKQELRATILRNYEIEVHTASTITEAATRWRTYSYDLVLVAAQEKSEETLAVTAQLRSIKPGQRIGLLVGPPTFVQNWAGGGEKLLPPPRPRRVGSLKIPAWPFPRRILLQRNGKR